MPRMLLPLVLLAAVTALLLPATAPTKTAAWKACFPAPAYPMVAGAPTGTLKAVGARGATCAVAKSVAVAYTRCRLANGVQGRCVKRVQGYACRETRTTDPTAGLRGSVTCSKDGASVRHQYAQDAPA